jgi:hypothetical protein
MSGGGTPGAIRDMLPLALAIAVSPVPVLAVVLMLVSDRGRTNAYALLTGWALALTLVGGGVAVLGIGAADDGGDDRHVAVAQFVLAGILVAVIAAELRRRSRRAASERPPRWLALLAEIGPGRAVVLGVALVVLNAKDASLTVVAGARLAEAGPGAPGAVLAVALFVLVASSTVIAPVAVDLALGERAAPVLQRWRTVLERHGSTAVIATLAAVAAVLVVQGSRGL